MYAGPEFLIYSQNAFALVLIFTTFLYGVLMPILFFVCMIGLINMYIVDNIALTYFYRKPPMYDDKLNERVYSILLWAPALTFTFGYWALTNA